MGDIINVRVVLDVEVDPDSWAERMMGKPEGALVTAVRKDVKRWIRDHIATCDAEGIPPIGRVNAQGIFD